MLKPVEVTTIQGKLGSTDFMKSLEMRARRRPEMRPLWASSEDLVGSELGLNASESSQMPTVPLPFYPVP